MEKLINCPDCCSTEIVKNGSISNGKYKGKRCGRQFVLDPQKQPKQPIFQRTKSSD